MANLILSSLDELNITVKLTSPEDFFLSAPNPPLTLDSAILTARVGPFEKFSQYSDSTASFLGSLDIVTRPSLDSVQPNLIIDFTRETLRLLGFSQRGVHLSTRYPPMPLIIRGDASKTALPALSLLHRTRIPLVLLLVVEENTIEYVLCDAIAAFQFNNPTRIERGLPPLECMTIPCIGMDGTRPTFYLVPVTRELSNAVIGGGRPEAETVVEVCSTPVDHGEGMEDTRYRELALQCMLAFKELAKTHWDTILDGLE
ncbi:hypothetical protein B0H19DRAFT_1009475 [Mycena capillaripes]|nr:hypothetical protein B0H19DRAFT_1009475 [Mycena capillaripes]